MGTNYYIKTEKCEKCGHHPEGIHLGKSSAGWKFSFQYNGGQYYKNVIEMKEWLKDKAIVDEYGNSINNKQFWDMVEKKQKESFSHAERFPSDREVVSEGYSFSNYEFS